jgi:hypothetical protein
MTRRQEGLGLKANDTVAAKMEEILDAALAEWSSQVQATLNGGHPATGQPPASGQQHANAPQPPNGYPANGNGYPANGNGNGNGNGNPVPGQPGYGQQLGNGHAVNGNHPAYPPAPGYGPPAANGQLSGSQNFGLPDPGDAL